MDMGLKNEIATATHWPIKIENQPNRKKGNKIKHGRLKRKQGKV